MRGVTSNVHYFYLKHWIVYHIDQFGKRSIWMWKQLNVLYVDEFRTGSLFHCKSSSCCASRTFASQRGASHICRALLTIATGNCALISVKDSGRGLISRMQQFQSKATIVSYASAVFSTNYWIVLNVDGLCSRTLYKWEQSIAHCVDDFTLRPALALMQQSAERASQVGSGTLRRMSNF